MAFAENDTGFKCSSAHWQNKIFLKKECARVGMKKGYIFLVCVLLATAWAVKSHYKREVHPVAYATKESFFTTLHGNIPPRLPLLIGVDYGSLSDKCMESAPLFHPTRSGLSRANHRFNISPDTEAGHYSERVPLVIHMNSCDWRLEFITFMHIKSKDSFDTMATLMATRSIKPEKGDYTGRPLVIRCEPPFFDSDLRYSNILRCKAYDATTEERFNPAQRENTPWLRFLGEQSGDIGLSFELLAKP